MEVRVEGEVRDRRKAAGREENENEVRRGGRMGGEGCGDKWKRGRQRGGEKTMTREKSA